MFGIGPMEIILIAIVAIVFVGPQRLPEVMKKFGKMFVQVRRQTQDVRNSFNEVLRDAERELELDRIRELKKQVDQVRSQNILDMATQEIKPEHKQPKDDKDYHDSHYIDGKYVHDGNDEFMAVPNEKPIRAPIDPAPDNADAREPLVQTPVQDPTTITEAMGSVATKAPAFQDPDHQPANAFETDKSKDQSQTSATEQKEKK